MRKYSVIFDLAVSVALAVALLAFAIFAITHSGDDASAITEQTVESPEPAPGPEISPETAAIFPEARETTPTTNQTHTETTAATEAPRRDPYHLTEEERLIVEAVVGAETAGEDFDGQCLVAMCIRNTAEATGMSPADVALEPGQYATPNYNYTDLVSEAVAAVFDEGYQVTEEPVRYFYAPALCVSQWHEQNLEYVLTHGGHRFFKEA